MLHYQKIHMDLTSSAPIIGR